MEAKLSRRLEAGLQAAEDRQNLCFSIFSRKIDKPLQDSEYKFQGDRRFHKVLEEIKDSLEESFFHLRKDLPSDSKAWDPFNEVVAKVQEAEDNIITAQMSRHGWKLIDEYTDKKRGFAFIEDRDKAKELKELEKQLDKQQKDSVGAYQKKSFGKQSSFFGGKRKNRSPSRSPYREYERSRERERSRRESSSPAARRRSRSPVSRKRSRSPFSSSSSSGGGSSRRYESSNSTSAGSSTGAGTCVWCSQTGHFFKLCPKFYQDLENGKAKYNKNTRRWYLDTSSG